MKNSIFIFLQHVVPQHLLSRIVGWFASTKIDWIRKLFIRQFIKTFNVNMTEALNENPDSYACFNDFFTRELKPDARTMELGDNTIISPADGCFSQLGRITNGRIFQAKGHAFTATELLGGDTHGAANFQNGKFATIYLSPKDYHRLHMPLSGKLRYMTYVPGDLFSVNPTTTENVPNLFARNERLVCVFDTAVGPVAMVLVGAMIVAAIETVWAGQVTPYKKSIQTTRYDSHLDIHLKQGEEMGLFKLGSTIILLFPENAIAWEEKIRADMPVTLGQKIGSILKVKESTEEMEEILEEKTDEDEHTAEHDTAE